MSLIPRNHFFNEIRKAFRTLEEPFLHHSKSAPARTNVGFPGTPLFKAFGLDDLGSLSGFKGAYIKEAEDGKNYLVEAELPGVKKENLKVEFSDNGEVLHIEGFKGSLPSEAGSGSGGSSASASSTGDPSGTTTSNETAVDKTNKDTSVVPDWATESFNYGTFHETFVSLTLYRVRHATSRVTMTDSVLASGSLLWLI